VCGHCKIQEESNNIIHAPYEKRTVVYGCIKFNAVLDCFITHHSICAGISSIPYLYLLLIPSLSC